MLLLGQVYSSSVDLEIGHKSTPVNIQQNKLNHYQYYPQKISINRYFYDHKSIFALPFSYIARCLAESTNHGYCIL
jgi:hypothetical protein